MGIWQRGGQGTFSRQQKEKNMQNLGNAKSGYYTIHMNVEGKKIPYVVFAASDYHAARLVRSETGYAALPHEIEGPYLRG